MERPHLSEPRVGTEGPAGPGRAREPSPLMETLLRFESAHKRRSVAAMRACFADGAIIESVASGRRPLGADETAAALAEALRDHVYSIGDWRYEQITPEIILSITGARHLRPGSTMTDETVYRIVSGRNGLMWRVKLFGSRDEALEYLARHGPDLGLSRPADPG